MGAMVRDELFYDIISLSWLQNYISLNLSFSAATASGWRKKIFTVAAATAQIFFLALLVSLKKS